MGQGNELTERQQYWLSHLRACEEGGQTTKAYADEHGLSVSMMYSWRKELTVRGVLSRPANGNRAVGFDRIRVTDSKQEAEVWRTTLPNGVRIEAPISATDSHLLLAALMHL